MRFLITLVAGAGLALVVAAAEPAAAQDGDALAFSLGAIDVDDKETAAEARVEYRTGPKLFNFGSMVGFMWTTDASAYVYGGFYYDWILANRFVIMPNVAVGLYRQGKGKDLGSVIEFRSGVEIAYRFANRSRLGAAYHHMSNAGIDGLNPGTESMVVTYVIPFDWL